MGLKGYENWFPEGENVKVLQTRAPGDPPPHKPVIEEARPSKYRNRRTEYRGEWYDSKAEADYAAKLDLEKQSIPGMWWIRQVKFALGVPENTYRVDFLVYRPDLTDPVFAVDVKGADTSKFRHDVKLWAAYGPCRLCVIRRAGKGWTCEIIDGGGKR